MTEFVTFDVLLTIGNSISDRRIFLESRATRKTFNTFLSYSSTDYELLPGVIKILENHSAVVYTDIGDDRLPEKTTPETAQMLKLAIKECQRFILFVTTNSEKSRWISWELGLGDGMKSIYNIALLPSAQKSNDIYWSEQEYLGLYQRIIWGSFNGTVQNEWIVLNHHKNTGTPLRKWIGGILMAYTVKK